MKINIAAFVVFICAATDTAGGVKDRRFCPDKRWRMDEGLCYYADFHIYRSLPDAKYFCGLLNATMLTIKSARQLKFVRALKIIKDGEFWLDLYRRTNRVSPGWYWGDGTPFVPKFLKWSKGLESIYAYATIALTTQGTLIPIRRSATVANGYICEEKPRDQTCPRGFKLRRGTCFFLSNLSNTATLIYGSAQASQECRKVAKRSKLLEIRSKERMRTVKNLIKDFKSSFSWYIGLNKNGDRWIWKSDHSDASSVKSARYIKWANENDNLGGDENCAVLYKRTGRIRDIRGKYNAAAAVCMKPASLR